MEANNNLKILVTGGTGFAGTHLIYELKQQGYTNIHSTSYGLLPENLTELLPEENFHKLDLTNAEATEQLIKDLKPNHIYHLASFAFVGESFARAHEVFGNNINLQVNILEAVRKYSPESRILIIGSGEEYGVSESDDELPIKEDHPLRPVNPYAVSKVTQDLLAYSYSISFGLQVLRVRPFNHIGEGQSTDFVVPAFVSQIVAIENGRQEELKAGSLEAARDFSDVKDVVKAYIRVMEKGKVNEVYNIGSGTGIKLSDLFEMMKSMTDVPVSVQQDKTRMRPLDVPVIIADISKISQLGWSPDIPLEKTLERIFAWYRAQADNL